MSKFVEMIYKPDSHGSFDEEWGCHKNCHEWWYCTGYIEDESAMLYSFQFTLIRLKPALKPYIFMSALTDFQTGEHFYSQKATLSEKDIGIGANYLSVQTALLEKEDGSMTLKLSDDEYSLDLDMGMKKPPVWHCDNGKLQMGITGKKQTTLYYSYTNLAVNGRLVLKGKKLAVSGKAWFDKQGGSYAIANRLCHWEWFSLRFFDDEEMMLFSFPQDDYRDGSYIDREGRVFRLTDYTVKPLEFTDVNSIKFSCKWQIDVPGRKEELYYITPLSGGQLNLAYYELLAKITNEQGEQKGMCFVELLPGVYNKKINPLLLFKKL